MRVPDASGFQESGQSVGIELGIVARTRDRADIDDSLYPVRLETARERLYGQRRMPNGEDWPSFAGRAWGLRGHRVISSIAPARIPRNLTPARPVRIVSAFHVNERTRRRFHSADDRLYLEISVRRRGRHNHIELV